jgi:hypothetical protein
MTSKKTNDLEAARVRKIHASLDRIEALVEMNVVLVDELRGWIDPTFEYALPHAKLVLDLADELDRIAGDLETPATDALR